MSERKVLWIIAAVLFVISIICGIGFVVSGFFVLWMFATIVGLVGSFMAFAVSFAA